MDYHLIIIKKLQFNDVKAKELLDIKQMRHVRGGASGTCGVKVNAEYAGITTVTTDTAGNPYIETIPYQMCNISYEDANKFMASGLTIKWCCDSCKNTDYCG